VNVGIFADCYRPTTSGVVTSLLQLKEGLEQRGHKAIVVAVATPGTVEKDPSVHLFPSLPFNSASGFRLGVVNQAAIQRIARQHQLDIVHTHTEYSLGWAGKRAAGRLGLPHIHTAHTLHEEYRHYLFCGKLLSARMVQAYLRRFLSGCDTLVCPSRKAQSYYRSFLPGMRITVIRNGVCRARLQPTLLTPEEKAQAREAMGIGAPDRVLLHAGRLAKEKRVLELLDALAPLLLQRADLKALFVGSGPLHGPMIQAAERHNVQRQVLLAGTVDWERMHRYYALADVFVTASLSEVQPMTLIEASMCGLPIVARRDEAYLDLVEEGTNGSLADSDRQLAERVSALLADEARLHQLSANACRLSAHFDVETHVDQLEALYQSR
jgi:1,2-diacylglycerol 3-alpha-glucosyltransferase